MSTEYNRRVSIKPKDNRNNSTPEEFKRYTMYNVPPHVVKSNIQENKNG